MPTDADKNCACGHQWDCRKPDGAIACFFSDHGVAPPAVAVRPLPLPVTATATQQPRNPPAAPALPKRPILPQPLPGQTLIDVLDQPEVIATLREHNEQILRHSLPAVPPPPRPAPTPRQPLSLDQMIGICCGLFALAVFGLPSPSTILVVGGIGLVVAGYYWLKRHAPVTANIIFIIFGFIILVLLSMLSGGRRRRRW